MNDIWYYADGNNTIGPVSREDILKVLSRTSNAKNILVWRDGFSEWQKAGSVPDFAVHIVLPPPLPPSHIAAQQKAASTSSSPALAGEKRPLTDPADKTKQLVGIGGWLILVAIGQILGPLIFLSHQFNYYSKLDSSLWTKYPVAFYGEAILFASFLLFCIYTAFLFFSKSHLAPIYLVYAYIAGILLSPIDAVFSAISLSAYTGQAVGVFLERIVTAEWIGQWIGTSLIAAIWIAYIKRSKRVANTFVEQRVGHNIIGDGQRIADKDFNEQRENRSAEDKINEAARRLWPNQNIGAGQ